MARRSSNLCFLFVLVVFGGVPLLVAGDDVTHDDGSFHGSPVCNNKFQLVKVMNWIDGVEGPIVVGLSAKFGAVLPNKATEALRSPSILANPINCCSNFTSQMILDSSTFSGYSVAGVGSTAGSAMKEQEGLQMSRDQHLLIICEFIRSEELETALMEMVKQDNRFSAKKFNCLVRLLARVWCQATLLHGLEDQ